MKIGILTFHRSINDGAVMQCYSLCQRLKEIFPTDTVEVIDYHMPKVVQHYQVSLRKLLFSNGIQTFLRNGVRILINPRMIQQQKERASAFAHACDALPLSKRSIISDDTEELFTYINQEYDVVIAGSDAIWNYDLRGYPNPYYLSTAVTIPKLSYAASCFGMSYEKISPERQQQIKEIMDDYCFLGVRDGESEKFLRFIGCETEMYHTCDPTAFLNVENLPIDETKLKNKLLSRGFILEKKTIGVMGGNRICRMIRRMYGEKYQIAALHTPSRFADVNLHDLTPYEWAYVFRLFSLTVTTFFHGTYLSLRNGVPVIALALHSEYTENHVSKVEDLLHRLNMDDCYFSTNCADANTAFIKKKADEWLSGTWTEMIQARIEKEAESVNPFIEQLRELKRINKSTEA